MCTDVDRQYPECHDPQGAAFRKLLSQQDSALARDVTCILSIAFARCAFPVRSEIPSSIAICLLSFPATTSNQDRAFTWRQMFVARFQLALGASVGSTSASRARAVRTADRSTSRWTGFVRKSTAPAFMALTLIGISPWPVRKMIGKASSGPLNAVWSSRPLEPGMRTSSTTHPGLFLGLANKNSSAQV